MRYVREPELSIDAGAIRARVHTALTERTAEAYLDSVTDIYALLAEVENVLRRERLNRFEFADLLATARAALAGRDWPAERGAGDALMDLSVVAGLHSAITAAELDAWRATGSAVPADANPHPNREEATRTK